MTQPPLVITIPTSFAPERSWALRVLFEHVIGIHARIEVDGELGTRVTSQGAPGSLTIDDAFFAGRERDLLAADSMPTLPVRQWDVASDLPEAVLCHERLPVLFGASTEDGSWLSWPAEDAIRISADLIGGAFFLLSRLEEALPHSTDVHGRLPGTSSLAYRAGFLDRPLVNEYGEVLFRAIGRLWPRIHRPRRSYQFVLSHDVDLPFCRDRVPRRMLGDLVVRRDPDLAVRRALSATRRNADTERSDVCFTFDRIMDKAEHAGVRSAFYFISGGHDDPRNARYHLSEPRIRSLFRRISGRGHEIGLHPSYHTHDDPAAVALEFRSLRAAVERLGITQAHWGGRQHYLRWLNPTTWQSWADAGLDYDSTVGFADQPGFRCGICVPYPVFNIASRKELPLLERPLVVMDGTLLEYQRLSVEGSLETIERLSHQCRRVAGQFTLLWHNNQLITRAGRRLFSAAVDLAA